MGLTDIRAIKPFADVLGLTQINHRIRLCMGLTCDEYVIIATFEKLWAKKEPFGAVEFYRYSGMEYKNVKSTIESLIQKGYLSKEEKKAPKPTDKWMGYFTISEAEFETFWAPIVFPARKVIWTGSKHDAKQKYTKARVEYDMEFLLNQKKLYFQLLSENITRPVMGCSVFLNMTTRRFLEDFKSQLAVQPEQSNQEPKEQRFPVAQQLTLEQKNSLYEQQ